MGIPGLFCLDIVGVRHAGEYRPFPRAQVQASLGVCGIFAALLFPGAIASLLVQGVFFVGVGGPCPLGIGRGPGQGKFKFFVCPGIRYVPQEFLLDLHFLVLIDLYLHGVAYRKASHIFFAVPAVQRQRGEGWVIVRPHGPIQDGLILVRRRGHHHPEAQTSDVPREHIGSAVRGFAQIQGNGFDLGQIFSGPVIRPHPFRAFRQKAPGVLVSRWERRFAVRAVVHDGGDPPSFQFLGAQPAERTLPVVLLVEVHRGFFFHTVMPCVLQTVEHHDIRQVLVAGIGDRNAVGVVFSRCHYSAVLKGGQLVTVRFYFFLYAGLGCYSNIIVHCSSRKQDVPYIRDAVVIDIRPEYLVWGGIPAVHLRVAVVLRHFAFLADHRGGISRRQHIGRHIGRLAGVIVLLPGHICPEAHAVASEPSASRIDRGIRRAIVAEGKIYFRPAGPAPVWSDIDITDAYLLFGPVIAVAQIGTVQPFEPSRRHRHGGVKLHAVGEQVTDHHAVPGRA